MTVPAYTGPNSSTASGVTDTFPYDFKILHASDLEVTVNGFPRVLDTDYTVTGVGNNSGGNVVFTQMPAAGAKVVRQRNMAIERTTNYINLGDLLAATLNNDQDEPILMIQQVQAQVDRVPQIPPGYPGVSLVFPIPEAGRLIGWNADETGLRNNDPTGPGDLLLRGDLADPTAGAKLVSMKQTGPGAVGRPLDSKLSELVSPYDFNAAGDGVTNDTASFTNASNRSPLVIATGGTFNLVTAPPMAPGSTLIAKLDSLIGAGAANLEVIKAILYKDGYFGGMPMVSDQRGKRYELMAGVIRQSSIDPTQWSFIDDVGHRPVGFDTRINPGGNGNLVAAGTDLPIFFRKNYGKVISFGAFADETLARSFGLSAGASVDVGSITLRASISRSVSGYVYWDGTAWKVSAPGIGFSAISATAISGSTVRVTHDWVYDNTADLTPWTQNGAVDPFNPILRNVGGAENFDVSFRNPTTGAFITTLPSPGGATGCSFAFRRGGNTPVRLDGVGVSAGVDFRLGGNIWLFGIMELAD